MILFDNLPRLCAAARSHDRVLDVGGWYRPLNLATHVIDIAPYETRQRFQALDPENPERFSADSWCRIDACNDPWPFADDYFDFSVCSHTLEDVPDPIAICRQLVRVSRAGYIEVPSQLREIFTKQRWAGLRSLLRLPLEIGFPHHHWLCDVQGNKITFQRKDTDAILAARAYVTRGDLGGKMTQAESGLCIWWQESFDYQRLEPPGGSELNSLRTEALQRYRQSKSS